MMAVDPRVGELQRLRAIGIALLACLSMAWPLAATGDDAVPKQVFLVVEGDQLIASNIRFSRFDELELNARERIIEQAVGEAVIVVFTNQRIIGYGVLSGWRPMSTEAGEEPEQVSAEDFAGLVVTNRRLLNFNGQTGVWGQTKRPIDN